jgi:apolipoprotein N-acyltransferase
VTIRTDRTLSDTLGPWPERGGAVALVALVVAAALRGRRDRVEQPVSVHTTKDHVD